MPKTVQNLIAILIEDSWSGLHAFSFRKDGSFMLNFVENCRLGLRCLHAPVTLPRPSRFVHVFSAMPTYLRGTQIDAIQQIHDINVHCQQTGKHNRGVLLDCKTDDRLFFFLSQNRFYKARSETFPLTSRSRVLKIGKNMGCFAV